MGSCLVGLHFLVTIIKISRLGKSLKLCRIGGVCGNPLFFGEMMFNAHLFGVMCRLD